MADAQLQEQLKLIEERKEREKTGCKEAYEAQANPKQMKLKEVSSLSYRFKKDLLGKDKTAVERELKGLSEEKEFCVTDAIVRAVREKMMLELKETVKPPTRINGVPNRGGIFQRRPE